MTDRASIVPQLLGAAVGIVLGSVLLFFVLGMLRDDGTTPEIGAGPEPSASEEPTAQPTGTPTTDGSEAPGEEPSEAAPTTAETATEAPSFDPVDPASVSIQVLDAVTGGDGSAARAVADELREAGYDVVVVNRAGRGYDETTVFWSTDQEAGGRQVAAELGATRAEATPDEVSLSDAVDVHVVVGTDRA